MSTEDKITDALKTDLKKRCDTLEGLRQNMQQINEQLDRTMKLLDECSCDKDDIDKEK